MNVTFWQNWFKWAQAKIISLAKSGDFLALAAFLGEFGEIGTEFVRTFEGLQTALKGKWYQVGLNLLAWAKANPDPLGGVRIKMREMEAKWGITPGGPATSAPSNG
jgi:hypothetical protein